MYEDTLNVILTQFGLAGSMAHGMMAEEMREQGTTLRRYQTCGRQHQTDKQQQTRQTTTNKSNNNKQDKQQQTRQTTTNKTNNNKQDKQQQTSPGRNG